MPEKLPFQKVKQLIERVRTRVITGHTNPPIPLTRHISLRTGFLPSDEIQTITLHDGSTIQVGSADYFDVRGKLIPALSYIKRRKLRD